MNARGDEADALMREAFPLHQSGDVARAEALYRRILAIEADYPDAHFLLGSILWDRHEGEDAIAHYRRAIAANPRQPAFHLALAQAYFHSGAFTEAVAYFQSAHELDPGTPESWNNDGLARQALGDVDGALASFDRALERSPDFPPALNNAGNLLRDLGRIEEALARLRRVCELVPGDPALHSNYLFTLNLSTQDSREEIAEEHRAYGARFPAPPVRPRPALKPGERLRIAYFSPDLRAHPVSAFVAPVLASHDRSRFEIHAFQLDPREDAVSERLRAHCDRWVNAHAMSDDELAAAIERAGIQVLVELAGHTSHNRLPVLARKPAPVIATWLGYLGTTGVPAVDFRITDGVCDPPGSERYSSERLKRLPHGHSCFEAPDLKVSVAPLPARRNGYVTFGSFNKSSKLNEGVLSAWARLLARVPGSRLLIVGAEGQQPAVLRDSLAAKGVARERVGITGRLPLQPMLEAHGDVDIALDTFPYNGTTTTFNSLWMGVPVLALAGEGAISRSAASILTVLGLPDWVAGTQDQLVAAGAAKAADLAALETLRAGLRAKLKNSPLMDGAGFTRALEKIYLEMWQS